MKAVAKLQGIISWMTLLYANTLSTCLRGTAQTNDERTWRYRIIRRTDFDHSVHLRCHIASFLIASSHCAKWVRLNMFCCHFKDRNKLFRVPVCTIRQLKSSQYCPTIKEKELTILRTNYFV